MVGIDSMVLIHAGVVPPKQNAKRDESLRVRATLLLHLLSASKTTIVLPTVAVAELLVPLPPQKKGKLILELQKRFVLFPFDMRAAICASDIWSRYKQSNDPAGYESRHVLKADSQIVGTCQVAGCQEFYSNDENCRKLVPSSIKARDLPTKHPDGDLYVMDDIRRGEITFEGEF